MIQDRFKSIFTIRVVELAIDHIKQEQTLCTLLKMANKDASVMPRVSMAALDQLLRQLEKSKSLIEKAKTELEDDFNA